MAIFFAVIQQGGRRTSAVLQYLMTMMLFYSAATTSVRNLWRKLVAIIRSKIEAAKSAADAHRSRTPERNFTLRNLNLIGIELLIPSMILPKSENKPFCATSFCGDRDGLHPATHASSPPPLQTRGEKRIPSRRVALNFLRYSSFRNTHDILRICTSVSEE